MKKVIQIVLVLVVIGLAYILFDRLLEPVRFKNEVAKREIAVIQRIKDIRTAEQAYKSVYGEYTGDFDSLIYFVLNDSLTFERSIGSADDSLSVASGEYMVQQFRIPVLDTIFSPRKLTQAQVMELFVIPYSNGQRYFLEAGTITTETSVITVPVFEARASYNAYLHDLDRQMVDNLIDESLNTYNRYPGIKVGDLKVTTNDAGNWGE